MGLRPWMLVGTLFLSPCVRESSTRRAVNAPATQTATTGAQPDTSTDAANLSVEPIAVPSTLSAVIDLVRREDWAAARQTFERLPEAVQRSREGRYVGGRTYLALRDDAHAVEFLHDLGRLIPSMSVDIARHEASALARSNRHAEARAAYEALWSRTRAERDRARGAIAAQAMGDNAAALQVMRTWPGDPPDGIDRASAWRHAGQVLEAGGERDGAVRAWRRILVDEPDSGAANEAREALARLGASLDAEQVLARADHLNDRARYTEVINELSPLPPMAGALEGRRLHLLGHALFYARNRYLDAHAMLRLAAMRADNAHREEDSFMSARALSRADRDDEAITAYDQVAQTLRGRWSDEASFRAAWLVAHHDRVDLATQRFRAFLDTRTDAAPQLRAEAAWEFGWMLYQAGRFRDAIAPLEQSGTLATRALERMRGRYWAALAALRMGDRERAARGWQAIRADRPLTYYALLSETRLRDANVTYAPVAQAAERRPAPPLPLPENVRWLRALGFDREAGALLAAQDSMMRARVPSDRADEVLSLGYTEMGEPRRAYNLAQRHNELLDHEPTAETRWAWDVAYPRPWAHWIEAAEVANGLPRHYLFSIMRQESAYDPRDVSNARAIGLLQMIPPTTRRVAQELGIEFREEMLFDPEYNIRVGGHYIGRLFRQYRSVLARAIGAYNGGPGAMSRWVARWQDQDLDVFVERIPFDETRTYVRRVIQNLARYRYLYGPRGDDWPLRVPLRADAAVDTLVDY